MTTTDVPREAPAESCDVIMKGGITSAVVYPRALCEFAKTYRLHGLGGTSAGAIGAGISQAWRDSGRSVRLIARRSSMIAMPLAASQAMTGIPRSC